MPRKTAPFLGQSGLPPPRDAPGHRGQHTGRKYQTAPVRASAPRRGSANHPALQGIRAAQQISGEARARGGGGLLTPGVIPPHHPGSGPRLQTHAVLVNAASVQTHADAPPSRVGPTDAHPVRKAGTSHARGVHGRRGPEGAGPYVLHLERLDLAARQAVGRRDDGRGGDAGEGVRGGGGGKEGRQKAPARRAA